MMQAKPTDADYEVMDRLLNGMQAMFDCDSDPDGDKPGVPLNDADALHWFRNLWKREAGALNRVYWAGRTAIENACVPDADVLKFKPIYAAAPALLAACKAAEEAYGAGNWCGHDIGEQLQHAITQAEAAG